MIKSELVDDESPNFNQNSEIDSTEAINMNALNKLKKQNLLNFNAYSKLKRNGLNIAKYEENSRVKKIKVTLPTKEFKFEEGIEDNFYSHLLDWQGSIAALGTKKGLNLFFPQKYNQNICSSDRQYQNLNIHKLNNLLALKLKGEDSVFLSNTSSYLIQYDCNYL